jgi:hypothetical protein
MDAHRNPRLDIAPSDSSGDGRCPRCGARPSAVASGGAPRRAARRDSTSRGSTSRS